MRGVGTPVVGPGALGKELFLLVARVTMSRDRTRWPVGMVRDCPTPSQSDDAPAVNCHDARQGVSALFRGGMSLTEWALVEAHVRQCVECRQE
jgi:hypothetical protein